jgi:hypothetical protein
MFSSIHRLYFKTSIAFIRPKVQIPAPPPDSSAIRRMQNRWEAETQQREAAAAKSQVVKSASSTRARDRWSTSTDTSTVSIDASRSTVIPVSQTQQGELNITHIGMC